MYEVLPGYERDASHGLLAPARTPTPVVRQIAKDVAGDRCLVAGNLSLTWMYEAGSDKAKDVVAKTFDQQLAQQVDAGVDFIIGETYSWLGEALIAAERAKRTGLPVMVTMSTFATWFGAETCVSASPSTETTMPNPAGGSGSVLVTAKSG